MRILTFEQAEFLIERSRLLVMEASYDYTTNFEGVYDDFMDFLTRQPEARAYLFPYFVDFFSRNPNDIQELAHLCYFAYDVVREPEAFQNIFSSIIETLLILPQLSLLHNQIKLISSIAERLALERKNRNSPEDFPEMEDFFEGTLVMPY